MVPVLILVIAGVALTVIRAALVFLTRINIPMLNVQLLKLIDGRSLISIAGKRLAIFTSRERLKESA